MMIILRLVDVLNFDGSIFHHGIFIRNINFFINIVIIILLNMHFTYMRGDNAKRVILPNFLLFPETLILRCTLLVIEKSLEKCEIF